MGQMKEMHMAIKSLKDCAIAISETAEFLEQAFSDEDKAAEPKQETALTLEDVRAVLADKSRSGKTSEVRALITSFGVEKLSDIDVGKFDELLQKAEVL